MFKFVELFPDSDPATAKAEMVAYIQANIPGWESRGFDDRLLTVLARLWSINKQQASTAGASIFKKFGETIANVPPILAAPATVTSTWTAIDDDGHEIEDGTEVKIPVPGGEPAGFVVVGDTVIAPGDTSTATGAVLLQAILPGTANNGLTGEATPINNVSFVDEITLNGASIGGVDEEDEDGYLDRLTEELQLLSLSIIVPRDAEIDARSHPGVARALCIPGYNADTEEEDVPLCWTIIPATAEGASLGAPGEEALQASQAAKMPSGVLNFVAAPTHTGVDAKSEFTVLPGYDPVAVKAAVLAAKGSYFASANWGLPTAGDASSSAGWVNQKKVYRNEVIAAVDRVAGVDRVINVELAKAGDALSKAESITLPGIAPLTEPGDIEAVAA